MSMQFIIIMLSVIAAFVAIALIIGITIYDRQKKKKLSSLPEDDWLFGDFQKTFFNLFYSNAHSDSLCGVNIKNYDRFCKILHRKNDMENIVAMRIEGMTIFLICAIIALIMMNNPIFAIIFLCVGAAVFYAMWMLPYNHVKNQVDERLYQIQSDLPRFLSLLEKAMDLPIDQAMLVTATRFKSPLSDDIIDSINKVALGANGWQETLYELAKNYNIEVFSDLILEIINAYDQGVNIRDLVNRKVSEVEEERMYAVEEHDSRIKTLIFLPIIGLKIVPLMVMIVLPIVTIYI